MEWSSGDKVTDQLRLVRPLVPAKSDRVWLADQLFWHKQVVVKVIPTELPASDTDGLTALADEAAQARLLQSPHVAPTLAYGVADDGTPFVLFEPLKGQTLRSSQKGQGIMEPRKARNIIQQAAEAVGEAHEQDMVHGALDPDNLFLCSDTPTLTVKVLNLGVSAACPRVHTDYVSPEYYLGKPIDAGTDIWSLGAIAFELVTGEKPFGQNHRLMLDWSLIPASERVEEPIGEELDSFFDRVFSMVPADRYATMAEAAEAFSQAILSPKRRPSVVDGVRLSRISRHHVLDVDTPKPGPDGSGE